MKHVGFLLAGPHYPAVSPDPGKLDGQFRRYLGALGCAPEAITVFDCHEGDIPEAGQCEAWIVSGSPLLWDAGAEAYRRLLDLVVAETQAGRPVFGFNLGEKVLTDALCPERSVAVLPRCLRNPFRSFWISDVLLRVEKGQLESVRRMSGRRDFTLMAVA